jgi:ubiquinone/menaquinone biosynthesis C-methylase UbiE
MCAMPNARPKYLLEHEQEFARLEKQSQEKAYDLKDELGLLLNNKKLFHDRAVLDAGCGSGVLARTIASTHPTCRVTASDISETRIEQARRWDVSLPNLRYGKEDISRMSYPENSFDLIFTRYVIQHLSASARASAAAELFRVLKPGGSAWVVDTDGVFFNLFPISPRLSSYLDIFKNYDGVDMFVGRKIPHVLRQAGFQSISWKIATQNFEGELKDVELGLIKERLDQATDFFSNLFGSEKDGIQFKDDYLSALREPDAVLYYNKFIVSAKKPTDPSTRNSLR